MNRLDQIKAFYAILSALERKLGGPRNLLECNGRMNWPRRGVYFFFEEGEERLQSGCGLRVVRVGTHAVRTDNKTTLWSRLYQHRGPLSKEDGDHRGSVFRRHLGFGISNRNPSLECESWEEDDYPDTPRLQEKEYALEVAVSSYIRRMPLIWLKVDDWPSPKSKRSYIEKNTIALLSNWRKQAIDPASQNWLGRQSPKEEIRQSGLWNYDYVDASCDSGFLDLLEKFKAQMPAA